MVGGGGVNGGVGVACDDLDGGGGAAVGIGVGVYCGNVKC